MSASSIFWDRSSVSTGESIKEYYSLIDQNKASVIKGKRFIQDDVARKVIIIRLRICGFVSKKRYKEITSFDLNRQFGTIINKLKKYSLIEEDSEQIQLTLRGMFLWML